MQTQRDKDETEARLRRLAAQLECALQQAIENPLLFRDSPLLCSIESECGRLLADLADHKGADAVAAETRVLAELVWEIRARLGRWQRLLDSAFRFYSTCFSSHPPLSPGPSDGLAYGMLGEWGGLASASHLSVDG